MKRKRILNILILALLLVFITLAVVRQASAQVGSGFDLTWNVIGGGGGNMGNAHYQIASTVGQTAVNTPRGSGMTLLAGFWQDLFITNPLFLPAVLK